ncbi:MAG: thioredoxin domain-containing protein [Maioricimonas sp. JB049]
MTDPHDPTRKANRLGSETSPYLLQHAYNPVDWYPWGDEAFDRAKAEDKPVFLSIGYSACHWCHVMERESFENEEIAELMNRFFVNIKVDREERPDVDQIYMSAVQLMTRHGGWPMSVFLTPDGRPFFGGTYWPPESRMGMPGFRDVIQRLAQFWTEKRDDVFRSAESVTEAVGRLAAPEIAQTSLTDQTLRNAMEELLSAADRHHGGFGEAPKFPHPMDVRVLLRCARRFENDEAREIACFTLDKMADGGIYDHLGGGFHRYSTDARWLVPHFEKMIYDNALLVPAYLEAFQLTGEGRYRTTVVETLAYIDREMTSSEGAFFSTQDADSEGEEGKFFVWSAQEIRDILGDEEARIFSAVYDVTPQGNWEGTNILNRPRSLEEAATSLELEPAGLVARLESSRQKLFDARSQRVAPGRDEKILVAWNGMMIAALAQASRVLDQPQYARAATAAADFMLENMRDDAGRLLHSYMDGRARFNAYLDDYACFIDGLVELYQATFVPRYLESAIALAEQLRDDFADTDSDGFFYTPHHHEQLIARSKDTQDSATPSGNAVAATALLKLGRLCGRTDLQELGYETLKHLSGLIAEHPRAGGQALIALDFVLGPTREYVFVPGTTFGDVDALQSALWQRFIPNKVVVRRPPDTSDDDLPDLLKPLLTGREPGDTAAVYVCEQGACQLPITDAEAFEKSLD